MATYRTIQGDTWDNIAYKTLGDGFLMDKVIAENPQYSDVFIFSAGVIIEIPDVSNVVSGDFPEWFR